MNFHKLKVLAALAEDINNGWVWLPERIIPERSLIRIRNCETGMAVYCEAIPIGNNFVSRYSRNRKSENKSAEEDLKTSVVINEWYRKKLGIKSTKVECRFEISIEGNFYGKIMASFQNPQVVVRLAMGLALIGVVLGIVGLIK